MIKLLIKTFLGYVLGYVKVRVESAFVERFINICIAKRISIWNMKREKAAILYANIGIRDFKRIKQIVKKTKSRVKILEKKGIPFIIHKYRKRKFFLVFFALILILLFIISNFVWNIEIIGETNIPKEELIKTLNGQGLKIGVLKKNISSREIINKMRLIRDDIAWMGISIKGTNVKVEIKESEKAPEIIDKNVYCNIVADKVGIITKINVQDGLASVKVGDLVNKGDVLVNGFLEGKYTDTRYVHAMADIEAKVWHSKKEKFYFNQQIKVATGLTEEKHSIKIKNFKINFYKTLSKFQNYDTINTDKKIMLFPNFYLPIEIIKKTNSEYVLVNKTYTEEELTEIAKVKINEELLKEIDEECSIIDKKINIYKEAEYVEIEIIYETIEKIGTKEKILF